MSIRKVFGASVPRLVAILSTEFVAVVLVAFVLATPIAWFSMRSWLEGFAYRIDLSAGVFVATGAASLAIALLTVGYQAIRAALADPVRNLRYE